MSCIKSVVLTLISGFSILHFSACQQDVNPTVDVVVIGGGLMGSSAAWHLSDRKRSVVLLEMQDSIYDRGSSYGEARIARSSNRGSDMWSYLHNRSVAEAEKLVDFIGTALPSSDLSMDHIYRTSPVTYVGRLSIFEKLYESLLRQKIDYKIATNPQEGRKVFNVDLPDSVLIQREYNIYSGTINPQILIRTLHQAIRLKGNSVKYQHKVHSIERHKSMYRVIIEDLHSRSQFSIYCKKIVSAAGPHTGKLLHEIAPYFDTLINPQRVFLAFLKIRDDVYNTLTPTQQKSLIEAYPVINSSTGTRHGSFFSMIEYFHEGNPIIKIGGHFQRSDIQDINSVWKEELSQSEVKWSVEGTERYLKMLRLPVSAAEIELVNGYSCVYSLTQTEVPFVTPILNENNMADQSLVVMAGMSGVGAKGAMTYGLIAANILFDNAASDPQLKQVSELMGFSRLKKDLGK